MLHLLVTVLVQDQIRDDVGRMANNIITSFRGMIDQLNWMDSNSKLGAYDKMDNLVRSACCLFSSLKSSQAA